MMWRGVPTAPHSPVTRKVFIHDEDGTSRSMGGFGFNADDTYFLLGLAIEAELQQAESTPAHP